MFDHLDEWQLVSPALRWFTNIDDHHHVHHHHHHHRDHYDDEEEEEKSLVMTIMIINIRACNDHGNE